MPNDFEKAAIVVLLCAPTEINKAWARSKPFNEKAVEEALARVTTLSADARDYAVQKMASISGQDREQFAGVAEVLKLQFWGSQEPHPSSLKAETIVKALSAVVT